MKGGFIRYVFRTPDRDSSHKDTFYLNKYLTFINVKKIYNRKPLQFGDIVFVNRSRRIHIKGMVS